MNKKISWLQNVDKKHLDSFWYGGDIVKIELGKRYVAFISAVGDIRLDIDGERYCDKNNGGCFKDYFEENKIFNDDDLKKAIENGRIEVLDGNWYEIVVYDNKAKEYIGNSFDCVVDDFDPDDDFSWVEDWIKENE